MVPGHVLTHRNDGGGEGTGHDRQHVEMELELEVVDYELSLSGTAECLLVRSAEMTRYNGLKVLEPIAIRGDVVSAARLGDLSTSHC